MSMFTATRWQVATYLLGVCPFSIAFLVFLNSSVSFVVTDLLGIVEGVGDVVGSLGFADELLALLACPLWGLLSDRIGVRPVCCIGYLIIGLALYLFVQAKNVYPQLLLGRLFFSLGGAAASTMVTAVLPAMSFVNHNNNAETSVNPPPVSTSRHTHAPSIASELTITPSNYQNNRSPEEENASHRVLRDPISKVAGFVGMATGCGALIALSIFLPLPARFQKYDIAPALALQYSYYVVGGFSIVVAAVCFFGLSNLQTEREKGWRVLLYDSSNVQSKSFASSIGLLLQAFKAGFTHREIFIGYVGGFVARASSVGISLFIPLLVNAAFSSSNLCNQMPAASDPVGLPDIKRRCPRAYVVAAELTGASQLIALLSAPIFGYVSSRMSRKSAPLTFAAICGIIGYPLFALQFDPHDENRSARVIAFAAVCLVGISQIGAIVCSLSILSTGVLTQQATRTDVKAGHQLPQNDDFDSVEAAPLLGQEASQTSPSPRLSELKGSVAGVYSFYGGAGILLLTKAGGILFDRTSTAAPFYMMASFNGILLVAVLLTAVLARVTAAQPS